MAPAGVIPPNDGPRLMRLLAPTDTLGHNPNCLGSIVLRQLETKSIFCREDSFADTSLTDGSGGCWRTHRRRKYTKAPTSPGSENCKNHAAILARLSSPLAK